MPKSKKGNSNKRSFLSKIKWLALLGILGPIFAVLTEHGFTKKAVTAYAARMTGFNPEYGTWSADNLKKGLLPTGIGVGGSFLAAKLKVNRYIPFINL